jgi:hypothetical protein
MKLLRKRKKPQTKPMSGMESTLTNMEQKESSEQILPQESLSKDTYHQSCETLLYWNFVKINLSGDLKLLGEGTPIELQTAWSMIIQEYVSLLSTEKSDTILNCYLKIVQTETKLTFLENALTYLKCCEWDKEIAERITLFGYSYIEPLEDRDE